MSRFTTYILYIKIDYLFEKIINSKVIIIKLNLVFFEFFFLIEKFHKPELVIGLLYGCICRIQSICIYGSASDV